MWKALLGGVVTQVVTFELNKRFGDPKGSDKTQMEARRMGYNHADKILTEIQQLIKTEPAKASAKIDEARTILKTFLGV